MLGGGESHRVDAESSQTDPSQILQCWHGYPLLHGCPPLRALLQGRILRYGAHLQFVDRHVGPRDSDIAVMLKTIGCTSLDDLINKTIPKEIITHVGAVKLNNG